MSIICLSTDRRCHEGHIQAGSALAFGGERLLPTDRPGVALGIGVFVVLDRCLGGISYLRMWYFLGLWALETVAS